jgi:hemoglobin-like flavoprotein
VDQHAITTLRESTRTFAHLAAPLTSAFYSGLFAQFPALRPILQPTQETPEANLLPILRFVVDHLDNTPTLYATLDDLGPLHARQGITRDHYNALASVLVATMQAVSLEHNLTWSADLHAQWTTALRLLSDRLLAAQASASPPPSPAPARSTRPTGARLK